MYFATVPRERDSRAATDRVAVDDIGRENGQQDGRGQLGHCSYLVCGGP